MPRVSIVIPSYNHGPYIDDAIKSVLSQTLMDWNLIIIDDGSRDNSISKLQKYTDSRIKFYVQDNQGAHAAINRGISQSNGDYIAILNSDDMFHHDRIKLLTQHLDANPKVALVGSYLEVMDERGKILGEKKGYDTLSPWNLDRPEKSFRAGNNLVEALLTENYFASTSNFMFRKEIVDEIGLFRPLRYVHDWDFAIRVSKQYGIALIPKSLLFYRKHNMNTIHENEAAMIFEILWLLAVHLPSYVDKINKHKVEQKPEKMETLLNSIYTFGADRILSMLLLERVADDHDRAIQMLDSSNITRKLYLEYIRNQLEQKAPTMLKSTKRSSTVKHILSKLFSS